jgi:hypothetical protein
MNQSINQLMDSLMIHCENMEQICGLIRLAAATSGVRYGMNLHDVVPGEEETYEYWRFLFPDSMGETLHLQSVTCLCCGNYMLCSTGNNIPYNAYCQCRNKYEIEESAIENKRKEGRRELMNDYDAFNEFVGLVLPVGAPDRLCEDVIGEISRFLV